MSEYGTYYDPIWASKYMYMKYPDKINNKKGEL